MMTKRQLVQAGLAAAAAAAIGAPRLAKGAAPAYRIEGQGEPVLLIAGYSCDLTVWDVAVPLIIGKGFRVIRFNNLGIERDMQFSPTDITISAMAQYAAELLAALDLPSVHVVGHSMGGQIAQELALASPERVCSLTLLSTWAKPSKRLSGLLMELSRLAAAVQPDSWQRIFLPWILTDSAYAIPGLVDQVTRANVQNPDRPSAALLEAQAAAIAASDTSDRLLDLKMPTLVAVGEHDILTPVAYSRELHQAVAGSTFELQPGGHGFIAEAAAELASRLAVFLRAHPIN